MKNEHMSKYKVLLITVKGETLVSEHGDLVSACCEAKSRQDYPCKTIYVVEGPGGSRYSISAQRSILDAESEA